MYGVKKEMKIMEYKNTRDISVNLKASEVISLKASDYKGLFVPSFFPRISYEDLCQMKYMTYNEKAKKILSLYLTDFTKEEISDCVDIAYNNKFENDKKAPLFLEQNHNKFMYILELFHGRTGSCKDISIELFEQLLIKSMYKNSNNRNLLIITDGFANTAASVLESFKNINNIDALAFYPYDGTNAVQRLQMNTKFQDNINVCAVRGSADDIQMRIKDIFKGSKINELLEDLNIIPLIIDSRNLSVIIAQVVYYFSAYCDLMNSGEIDYEEEKVNIVIPQDDLCNVLSAYYAKQMGLPVNKIICASNVNNAVTEFINTGFFNKNRKLKTTVSPFMDILQPYNLERLIYHLSNDDTNKVQEIFECIENKGYYKADKDIKSMIDSLFFAGYCSDSETKETIKMMYDVENYLCDPHTAVAINVYEKYINKTKDTDTPTIIVSTENPYKFSNVVLESLKVKSYDGELGFEDVDKLFSVTQKPIPQFINDLRDKPIISKNICNKDSIEDVLYGLMSKLR